MPLADLSKAYVGEVDVARVVHVHGGISPYADVLRAAGR